MSDTKESSEDMELGAKEEVLQPAGQTEQQGVVGLSDYDKIQGKWISIDDEKSIIEFNDNLKIDIYDGSEVGRAVFEMTDIVSEEGSKLVVGVGEDIFEYRVIELTGDSLKLIYLPRGNILQYRK